MRFPVFIGLSRSIFLIGALCVMHGAAGVILLVLPLPFFLQIALLAALAISLWRTLRPSHIRALRLLENGEMECVLSDGRCCPAVPLPDTTVFSWLVVLRLELEDEKRVSLTLFPDHMSREEFRALCVWLRWLAQTEETGNP